MRHVSLLVMGCLGSGCFVEAVAGYAPGFHETVTPTGGTAMESKSAATTLGVFVGFYFDAGYLQVSYAFPSLAVGVVNMKDAAAPASGIGTSSNHLRFDLDALWLADLPDSALVLRGTFGFDFISSSRLKMAPNMDFASSGDASGQTVFGGLTLAWRKHLALTGGLAYTSLSSAAGTNVGAIDASGISYEVRASYQWFPAFIVHTAKYWPGGVTRERPLPTVPRFCETEHWGASTHVVCH